MQQMILDCSELGANYVCGDGRCVSEVQKEESIEIEKEADEIIDDVITYDDLLSCSASCFYGCDNEKCLEVPKKVTADFDNFECWSHTNYDDVIIDTLETCSFGPWEYPMPPSEMSECNSRDIHRQSVFISVPEDYLVIENEKNNVKFYYASPQNYDEHFEKELDWYQRCYFEIKEELGIEPKYNHLLIKINEQSGSPGGAGDYFIMMQDTDLREYYQYKDYESDEPCAYNDLTQFGIVPGTHVEIHELTHHFIAGRTTGFFDEGIAKKSQSYRNLTIYLPLFCKSQSLPHRIFL